MISNALFAAGVAAVVLVLMGGTTWLSDGFWSAYGAYSLCLADHLRRLGSCNEWGPLEPRSLHSG